MSISLERLDSETLSEMAVAIRNAGIAGAGGAGFPSYAKWERVDEVNCLLMNHQESEPNYYMDKWLAREHAAEFAALFDALIGEALDLVVVGAKLKDRDEWMRELEAATNPTVYEPDDLPIDVDEESGVVVAYTDDNYQYGMESILLREVADVVLGRDLPMDHGWIVQNTETLYRIYRTLEAGEPMTRKYVHVDGLVPRHRFLEVPVGTTAADLLEAAGRSPADLEGLVLLDGGPGWCFEIGDDAYSFGVRKRTNCLLVQDANTAVDCTLGDGRVNVLEEREWTDDDHETEPRRLDPDRVRIPLVSNPDFVGVVEPSRPIVEVGDEVEAGEMIATPASSGISNAQHASIDGRVTEVTDTHVEIERAAERATAEGATETGREGGTERERGTEERSGIDAGRRRAADAEQGIYWTWCDECGEYAAMPDPERIVGVTGYRCENCS